MVVDGQFQQIRFRRSQMKAARLAVAVAIILGSAAWLHAQTAPNLENGWKPYGSYDGSHLDTVNLMNGNQMLHAPLLPNYPQRGGSLTMQSFLYQTSKSWQVFCTVALNNEVTCQWGVGRAGVELRQSEGLTIQRTLHQSASGTGQNFFKAYGYTIQDATGAMHQVVGSGPLDTTGESTKFDSIDTSGYHMEMSNPDSFGVMTTATVTDRHGKQYVAGSWFGGTDTGPTLCPQLPGNQIAPAHNGSPVFGGGVSTRRSLMTLRWASKIASRLHSLSKLQTAMGTSSQTQIQLQRTRWEGTSPSSEGGPPPRTIADASAATLSAGR
jgi:hypothetical protein